MPQYQGVWSLQQQMQALTSGQWATDPNFKNTTLLLQGDAGANGAQNNVFYDTSPNQFAITRNGNTTQGTFSPFSLQPGAWANYFGGSSDYLLLPSNSANFLHTGAADWTFECWFWATQTSTTATLFSTAAESAQVGIFIGLNNAVSAGINVAIYRAAGGGVTYGFRTNASVFTANTWNHVAITYSQSGNTYAIYLNGISQTLTTSGTASYSGSNATYQPAIGRFQDSSPGGYYSGYISNMRAVNGSRVYTANFTPSPVPLTAITSTAFLTCQSNRFIDNSTNAYAVTVNGTPSVQAFSPFAPQFQYTASGTGGSGYFDGTGDYLSSTQSAYAPSGDFTVEAWFYAAPDFSGYGGICTNAASAGSTGWRLVLSPTPDTIGAWFNGTSFTNVAYKPGQWYHVALVRSGTSSNNVSFYINGVRQQQITNTTAVASQSLVVGRYHSDVDNYYLKGYISAVRVVVGTAVYSGASFTLPTAPLTAITNTQLLTNFTNAGILDGTMKNNLETVGGASVSTSVVKYGSGSLSFDGSGDSLTAPSVPLFNYGSANFTVELWIYLNAAPSNDAGIIDQRPTSTNGNYFMLGVNSSRQLFIYVNSVYRIGGSASTVLNLNTWTHVSYVRFGSTGTLYINGSSVGTWADSTTYLQSPMTIGRHTQGGSDLNAYMDDLRITNGFARYTQNFIPPSVALPRQ